MKSVVVKTKPFPGQKPGTSGLRKPVDTYMQEHYTENFIQSTLLGGFEKDIRGKVLVVGGDGRYYNKEALQKVIQICAANEIEKLFIGHNGLFSTPAVSCIIKKYHTDGGMILTASHNPGGPHQDFGMKFNTSSSGSAPEAITNKIYEYTNKISEYKTVPDLHVPLNKLGIQRFEVDGHAFTVEVIDSVADYREMCKEIFNFPAIKSLFTANPPLNVLINAMHGVMGIYVKKIFKEDFGLSDDHLLNCEPLEDFGQHHPDPNLTYAADLVEAMKQGHYQFGAAFDGDGDRNMILGEDGLFVTPSDSVAFLAEHLECIPYFQKTGIKGFARSMPTSGALDRVAKAMNKPFFEVPTGWKFFVNLMDAGKCSLCGEESFGTGSDHVREKDGLWACLAWLSVMAHKKLPVSKIQMEHWTKYGRNFFLRYDYENCEADPCHQMMDRFEGLITKPDFLGKVFQRGGQSFKVALADNFCYKDPTDGSSSEKQGLRIIFEDSSRIILRLSGTGSSGATVRLYIEAYVNDKSKYHIPSQDELKPLVEIALELTQLKEFTHRDKPTVIT